MVLTLHATSCQPAWCCPTVTLSHLTGTQPATPSLGAVVEVPSGALQAGGGGGRGWLLCSSFIFSVGEECHPAASSFTWKFPLFFNCLLKYLRINFPSPAHFTFFHLLSLDLLLLIRNRQILREDVRCFFPKPSPNLWLCSAELFTVQLHPSWCPLWPCPLSPATQPPRACTPLFHPSI